MIVPTAPPTWVTPVSYVSLVSLALILTLLHGWVRLALLVPVLYLAAFVWENVMIEQPEPTRYIILGVLLIALMVLRPNGLLGEKRVEIIWWRTSSSTCRSVSMAFGGLRVVDELDLHVNEARSSA